jgi:hypothetical protein
MRTQSDDTAPEAEQVQIGLLRRASPARRMRLARSLSRTAIALSRRAVRRAHPELDEAAAMRAWVALQYGRAPEPAVLGTPGRDRMDAADVLDAMTPVVEALERLGVAYRISGSLASSAYGVARSTADVDLVADLRAEQVPQLAQALQGAYYLDEPAALDAIRRRSSFNLIHLGTMLKVDVFLPQGRPFDAEAARRTRQERIGEAPDARSFALTSPEDTILTKLERYRAGGETSERQWLDVQGVLKVQGPALDLAYLRRWAAALGIADLLDRALLDAGLPTA